MATEGNNRPEVAWLQDRAKSLGLKHDGSEWKGPCPKCGGTDRLRVNDIGVFCRKNNCSLPDILKGFGYEQPRQNTAKPGPKRDPAPNYNPADYSELGGAESNRPEIPEGSEPSGGAQAAGIPEAGNSGGKQPSPTGRKRSWNYRSVEGGTVTVHRIDPTEDQARNGVDKRIWREGKAKGPFLPLAGYKTGEDAPAHGIVVCEGEATCEALRAAGINATTWIGGTTVVTKQTDWEPLRGMTVALWPDNDDPGIEAMRELSPVLLRLDCDLKFVAEFRNLPKKADAADLSPERIKELVDGARLIEKIDGKTVEDLRSEPPPPPDPEQAEQKPPGPLPLDYEGLEYALKVRNIELRWNLRRCQRERLDGDTWRSLDDRWEGDLRRTLEQEFKGFKPLIDPGRTRHVPFSFGRERWTDLINAHLASREVDCFEEWLLSLAEWDGKQRLNGLFRHCFGVTDNRDPLLVEWASRYMFLGAVTRTFEPGKKLDETPVLCGPQAVGKSATVSWTFPEEFRDTWFGDGLSLSDRPKEQVEALEGRVIVEISEMHGSTRGEVERIKSFLSRQNDGQVRRAYARNAESSPRRCIFVGTSNSRACLPSDPSGNRRFVVISAGLKLGAAGIMKYLDENREQLWAEAFELHRKGVQAWLPESLKKSQAETNAEYRARDDLLEDRLDGFIEAQNVKASELKRTVNQFSTAELVDAASGDNIGILSEQERQKLQNSVKAYMERLGFVSHRFKIEGKKIRGYRRA